MAALLLALPAVAVAQTAQAVRLAPVAVDPRSYAVFTQPPGKSAQVYVRKDSDSSWKAYGAVYPAPSLPAGQGVVVWFTNWTAKMEAKVELK